MGEYCRKYPAVNVRTATMNSQQAWLHRDEVDLILIESAEDLVREPVEWTRTSLVETEISALVPVSHPLAALTAIPLEDLASEKLIWRE
ncbi:LysR substrate-binding domain-containing protein, partial [Acidithiobacillus thiooxidans]|uniref:LysR substrate-binding domain-containing protein n=1 Tax=Acidithiobacillus thiooxidans TaxID=930 RepID=UPI000A89B403